MIKKVLFISSVLLCVLFSRMSVECLGDVAADLEQAQAYVESDNFEQAEAIYNSIIQNYPATDNALKAQKGLTILYISWDKPAQADAAFEKLIAGFSAHPDIAQAVYDIAYCYGELHKNYEKARELQQYVLDNRPQSETAIWSQADLAACNISLGDDPNAEAAIEQLLTEFSDHNDIAQAVYDVADHYGGLQQNERARDLYKYALGNWPDSEVAIWSQANLAACNISLGDDPNAQAAVDKLLGDFSGHPDIAKAVRDLADHYGEVHQYEKARQLQQYVLDNWPEGDDAMLAQAGIAMSNIALGDDPNAQVAIDSLIVDFNDNPHLPDAISRIEEAYYIRILAAEVPAAEDEDYLNAVIVWEKVMQRPQDFFHDDPDLYYFIAYCYYRLGEYEKALNYCKKVVDKWPDYKYMGHVELIIGYCSERALARPEGISK